MTRPLNSDQFSSVQHSFQGSVETTHSGVDCGISDTPELFHFSRPHRSLYKGLTESLEISFYSETKSILIEWIEISSANLTFFRLLALCQ